MVTIVPESRINLVDLPQEILCEIFKLYYSNFDLILVGEAGTSARFLHPISDLLSTSRSIKEIAEPILRKELDTHIDASKAGLGKLSHLEELASRSPRWLAGHFDFISVCFDMKEFDCEFIWGYWENVVDRYLQCLHTIKVKYRAR